VLARSSLDPGANFFQPSGLGIPGATRIPRPISAPCCSWWRCTPAESAANGGLRNSSPMRKASGGGVWNSPCHWMAWQLQPWRGRHSQT